MSATNNFKNTNIDSVYLLVSPRADIPLMATIEEGIITDIQTLQSISIEDYVKICEAIAKTPKILPRIIKPYGCLEEAYAAQLKFNEDRKI